MGRFSFPIPNGWFKVAWSDELAPGQVLRVKRMGRELVVFRGESGEVKVLDAYCPHMGAHLGVGGKVEGDTIRCPFHGWRFDGEGRCVEVPYAKRIPPRVEVPCWPVREVNGFVLAWHHAEKAAPSFDVPAIPEYGSDEWTPYERRQWVLRTQPREMGENLVDVAHFKYVHGTLTVAEGSWENDGAYLHMENHAKMGTPRGEVDGTIDIHCHGPFYAVVRFGGIVDTLLVESTTPIDEETTAVDFAFSVRKLANADATRGVGAALIADIEKQVAQDTPIWENKAYLDRPRLCDGDGPIARYRAWYEQFLSRGGAASPAPAAGA